MGVFDCVFSSYSVSTGLFEKLDLVLPGKICHLMVQCGNSRLCSGFREKNGLHGVQHNAETRVTVQLPAETDALVSL